VMRTIVCKKAAVIPSILRPLTTAAPPRTTMSVRPAIGPT
jgi:hypothetical protein